MWSLLFLPLLLAPVAGTAEGERPPCCYTNPQYSGTCSVEPSADETCAHILEYLNAPHSQGKSYCGNTNIRSGWASQECEPPTPPPAP